MDPVSIEEARHALAAGDALRAESLLHTLLESEPDNALAWEGLAGIAHGRGDFAAAVEALRHVRRLRPNDPQAGHNLAIGLAQLGDRDAASDLLRDVLESAPRFLSARLHRGMYLHDAGRVDDACREYAAALRQARDGGLRPDAPAHVAAMLDQGRKSLKDAQRQAYRDAVAGLREAHGDAALARIDASVEIYLRQREPDYADPKQRPATMYIPGLQPRRFFEREEFPWLAELEAATDVVRAELQALMQDPGAAFAPYVQLDPEHPQAASWTGVNNSPDWSACHLFRHGNEVTANAARCPRTMELLAKLPLMRIRNHAPEVVLSVLRPHAHIPPHYGSVNGRLIVHLPLVVPPDCGFLAVAGEKRGWEEGKCLVFDDSFAHEAWNDSDQTRVVMLLDIWNPQLTAVEQQAFAGALTSLDEFNVRVLGNQPMTFA